MVHELFNVPRRWLLLAMLVLLVMGMPAWSAEPVTLRVLTYNIHHGAGMDSKLDLPRIAAVIEQARPDIVALQEVDQKTTRVGGIDETAELGRLTGMHAVFGKAMDYAGGEYGEAILSRFPLQDVRVHNLPFTPGNEPRAAISARLHAGEGGPEILFVGTHLEHANAELRLEQARRLQEVLVAEKAPSLILAGDLNASPGSPPLQALEGWVDTSADNPAPTCPAEKPTVKIDYVLFRPAGSWKVIETQVLDESVASDHRPLLTVLQWQGDVPRK